MLVRGVGVGPLKLSELTGAAALQPALVSLPTGPPANCSGEHALMTEPSGSKSAKGGQSNYRAELLPRPVVKQWIPDISFALRSRVGASPGEVPGGLSRLQASCYHAEPTVFVFAGKVALDGRGFNSGLPQDAVPAADSRGYNHGPTFDDGRRIPSRSGHQAWFSVSTLKRSRKEQK